MSLTFLKTWWLHHKRCSARVEYKTMPFPETGLTLKVVPQIIFSLCSQISASSPWMHQAARCWSDSSPAVSGIWCNAYCNSHISCAASDAPARALFPPQPCASRERPSHEVNLFIYNLHSSSEHPFTSRWEGAVILLKILLSLLSSVSPSLHHLIWMLLLQQFFSSCLFCLFPLVTPTFVFPLVPTWKQVYWLSSPPFSDSRWKSTLELHPI